MPDMIGSLKFYWLKSNLSFWIKVIISITLCLYIFNEVQFKKNNLLVFFKTKVSESKLEHLDKTIFSLNPQYLNPEIPKVFESFYAFLASSLVFGKENIKLVDQNTQAIISLKPNDFTVLYDTVLENEAFKEWQIRPLAIDQGFLIAEVIGPFSNLQKIKIPVIEYSTFDHIGHDEFLKSIQAKQLQKAKCYGEDLLYKNSVDTVNKDKIRLCLKDRTLSLEFHTIYFVRGDYFETSKGPADFILMLKKDQDKLCAIISDSDGKFEHRFLLQSHSSENADLNLMIPKNIHYLSKNAFGGMLGLQKMVFKEGDWILKEKNFFRHLRSKNEIEELLSFKKQGLLLIIDNIKEAKNQLDINLKVFSPQRTQMQEKTLQVLIPKPESPKSKKRAVKQK